MRYKRIGYNINVMGQLFKWFWIGLSLVCCLAIRGLSGGFLLLRYFSGIVSHPRVFQVSQHVSVESS